MNTVIGKKIQQKQTFLTDGTRIPVTVIDVLDNTVLGVKTQEKNGYSAVQIGYGRRKKAKKSLLGQVKKAHLTVAPIVVREVKMDPAATLPALGEHISIEAVLKPGDIVKVTGTAKGKGFAGVVKRHHFRGGPRTHGQSDRERAPGSIGQTTTPGRVYKGKRMAGRMGYGKSSVQNLQVISIGETNGRKTVLVKGLVPGSLNSIVIIHKTGELPENKIIPLVQSEDQKPEAAIAASETNAVSNQAEVQNTEESVEIAASAAQETEKSSEKQEGVAAEDAPSVVKEDK